MSSKLQVITALLAVALLVVALASSATAAGRVLVDSRATLAQDDPFHGKVISRKDACERTRTVSVYLVKAGADGLYDTTRSNAQGEWSIPATPTGDFYALAKPRSIDTGSTTLVCKRATSPAVTF